MSSALRYSCCRWGHTLREAGLLRQREGWRYILKPQSHDHLPHKGTQATSKGAAGSHCARGSLTQPHQRPPCFSRSCPLP